MPVLDEFPQAALGPFRRCHELRFLGLSLQFSRRRQIHTRFGVRAFLTPLLGSCECGCCCCCCCCCVCCSTRCGCCGRLVLFGNDFLRQQIAMSGCLSFDVVALVLIVAGRRSTWCCCTQPGFRFGPGQVGARFSGRHRHQCVVCVLLDERTIR